MSFDLMVFNAAAAPRAPAEFFAWYELQTDWRDEGRYDDPAICEKALRAWFTDMIVEFPAANGADASAADSPRLSDYSLSKEVIYAAFAWSQADAAFAQASALAGKHGLGLFNPSSLEGRVSFPDGLAFDANPPAAKPWWKFW
ncbi:hypothetical protein [Arenimonas sp.]|uniref:hypothetical protein n=1 Tax=Arenimonas sp. TaxID=1872635 RepID=UPI0039E5E1C7